MAMLFMDHIYPQVFKLHRVLIFVMECSMIQLVTMPISQQQPILTLLDVLDREIIPVLNRIVPQILLQLTQNHHTQRHLHHPPPRYHQ